MAQQLNLYDPQRRKPRATMDFNQLGLLMAVVLGLGVVGALTLNGLTIRERSQQRDDETQLNALRAGLPGAGLPADRVAELERWRNLEAGRLQVQAAMAQHRPAEPLPEGASIGHGAPYFEALARQAQGALWLTAFSVSADGRQLELSGRMLSAAALPGYLRALNDEPLFRGRPFAQLEVKTGGTDAAPESAGFTEFTLRTQASREEARK